MALQTLGLSCAGCLCGCLLLLCAAGCHGTALWLTGVATFSGLGLNDTGEDTGFAQRLGAEIMREQINSNPGLLPGYELKVVWQDGCCDANVAYRLLLENLLQESWKPFNSTSTSSIECSSTAGNVETWTRAQVNPGTVGLLGPGCSSAAARMAEAADSMAFPMISGSAALSKLNDGSLYRNFFRTVLPDLNVTLAFLALASHLRATDVLSIVGNDDEWTRVSGALGVMAEARYNLTYASRNLVSADSSAIQTVVKEEFILRQQRMVALLLDRSTAQLVLCELQSRGYYGSVFMTFGRFRHNWWQEHISAGCTSQDLSEATRGMVAMSMQYWRKDDSTQLTCASGMTGGQFRALYDSQRAATGYVHGEEAATVADALCMFALMLHKLLFEKGFTVDDLQARNRTVYQEAVDAFRTTSFEGLQGSMLYQAGSPNPLSTVVLQQLQSGSLVEIGTYTEVSGLSFGPASMQLPYAGSGDTFSAQPGDSHLAAFDTCTANQTLNFTSNVCLECPVGRQVLEGNCVCKAGFQKVGSDCVACPAGSITTTIESANCTLCAPGRFSSVDGSDRCELCPANTFASSNGTTQCTSCAALQVTLSDASTGRSDCVCKNAYKESVGDRVCTSCPSNSTTTGSADPVGAESCRCNANFYMQDGRCERCPDHSTTDGIGKQSVHDCHCVLGRFLDSSGVCRECPEGMLCLRGSDAKNRECLLDGMTGCGFESCNLPVITGLGSNLNVLESCYSNVSRRFPLLKAGYWANAADDEGYWTDGRQQKVTMPTVFDCMDTAHCNGGRLPGDVCVRTRRNIIACQHCMEGEYWDADRTKCVQCSSMQQSKFFYPVLPILLAPVVILLFYRFFGDALPLWGSWQNSLAALAFIVLNHYQVLGIVGGSSLSLPASLNGPFGTFKATTELSWGLNKECVGLTTLFDDMISKSLYPVILGVAALIAELVSMLAGRADPAMRMDRNRLLNVYLSIMFTFFGAISAMSLLLFKCSDNPPQTSLTTLSTDRSVICFSSLEWKGGLGVAIACVAVYILFMGSVFLWAICRAPSHFGDPGFQMRWKFLFIKFHAGAYWWGVVFLMKNFMVNLVPVVVRDTAPQLYVSITVILLYLAGTVLWLPYRTEIANWFEVIACIGIVYVTSLLTWHATRTQIITDRVTQATVAISLVPIIALPGVFLYVFMRGTRLVKTQSTNIAGVKKTFECLATVEVETGVRMLLALTEAERRSIFNSAFVLRADHLGHRSWRRINQSTAADSEIFSSVYSRLRAQSINQSAQQEKVKKHSSGVEVLKSNLNVYTSGRGSSREVPFAARVLHV